MSIQSAQRRSELGPISRADAPIWSQITAREKSTNRDVKNGAEVTLGRGARGTLRTWVILGVFHNTTGKRSRRVLLGPISSTKMTSDFRMSVKHFLRTNGRTVSRDRLDAAGRRRTRLGANLHVSLIKRRGRFRAHIIDLRGGRLGVVGTCAPRNLLLYI